MDENVGKILSLADKITTDIIFRNNRQAIFIAEHLEQNCHLFCKAKK